MTRDACDRQHSRPLYNLLTAWNVTKVVFADVHWRRSMLTYGIPSNGFAKRVKRHNRDICLCQIYEHAAMNLD